jgi:hypothetical protein
MLKDAFSLSLSLFLMSITVLAYSLARQLGEFFSVNLVYLDIRTSRILGI